VLHSQRWRELRARLIVERGGCERCGYPPGQGDVALTLHHLTYRRFGAERDEDLEVLCVPCHEARYREDNPHLIG
jgi:5-methylcytosine-specific restriction endonuclease McrA